MTYRLLDLFSGAGGAAMGYHQAGFEVVGVDIKSQPHYPFEFHQADALTYPLDGFDAIHASPPCQAYVDYNKNKECRHPKLIEPTMRMLRAQPAPYVIENVIGTVLQANLMLCGTMFGLKVIRHRYFNCSFQPPLAPFACTHDGTVAEGDFAAVYAFGGHGRRHGKGIRDPKPDKGPNWNEAMQIDWMNRGELAQAIPPAYTEYIGKHLIAYLEATR